MIFDFSGESLQQDAVLPDRRAVSYSDALADFLQTVRDYGLIIDHVDTSGKVQRCATDDKPNKQNGWLRFTELDSGYFYGSFGNWRESEEGHSWKSWTEQSMTQEERESLHARIEQRRKTEQQEAIHEQQEKSEKLAAYFHGLPPATEHPYKDAKRIMLYGDVRIDSRENCLVVPLQSIDGQLVGVQRIYSDKKRTLGVVDRTPIKPFIVLPAEDNEQIYVAEGFATAASVREASGCTTIAALTARRLKVVSETIRSRFPKSELIIVADNDTDNKKGNIGVKCAQEAAIAVNGRVVIPDINGEPLDANDVSVKYGTEMLKAILGVDGKSIYGTCSLMDVVEKDYPHNPVIEGLLDEGEVLIIGGDSNLGKSIITLHIAALLGNPELEKPSWSGGMDFNGPPMLFGHFPILSMSRTLFLQNENSGKAVKNRLLLMMEKNESIRKGVESRNIITMTKGEDGNPCASGSLDDEDLFRALKMSILKEKIRLLVVDPLSSYHGAADENANVEMLAALNKTFGRLAEETGVAIILVHHTGKDGVERGVRGASSIKGWTDGLLTGEEVEVDDDGKVIKMHYVKSRNFERRPSEWYMRMGNDLNFTLLEDYEPPTEQKKTDRQADTMDVVAIVGKAGEFSGKASLINTIASEVGCSKTSAKSALDKCVLNGLVKCEEQGPAMAVKYKIG